MDELTAQWLSHELMEVDDYDDVKYPGQLAKSIKDSTLDSLCITTNEYSRVAEAFQVCNLQPPAAAKQVIKINDSTTYTSSSQKAIHEQCDRRLSSVPSTKIISFGEIYGAPEFDKSVKRYDNVNMMPTVETQNNSVVAERKRRQRLTRLFVSLSTTIPGLNKLDKASILAGAIEYLKQLQQRIQVLEEEEKKEKRRKYEKSASVSYNQIVVDQSSPEVKVRTCKGNVLMEIYCRKRPRILNDILCEIEKLHLCIISTSVIPFGKTALHITITAQESDEFCMRAPEVANVIRGIILN